MPRLVINADFALALGARKLGKCRRATRLHLGAGSGKTRLHIGLGQHLAQCGGHPLDHRRAQARRPHQALEAHCLQPRQAQLTHRGHIRQGCIAPAAGDGQRLQPPALDVRQQHRAGVDQQMRLAADQVCDGRRAALVGHMQQVEPGHAVEQLTVEVR